MTNNQNKIATQLQNRPDSWTGWRFNEEGQIDYSTEDRKYLRERKKFLLSIPNFVEEYKKLFHYSSYPHNRLIFNWGCGSGKTNKIKTFASISDLPIVIVVKSNEEIDRMVFDIKSLNPNQSVIGWYDNQVQERIENGEFDYLSNFKVLVTNNYRILNEPQSIWMKFQEKQENAGWFMKSTMGISDHKERKLIIFDEIPKVSEKVNYDYGLINTLLLKYGFVDKNAVQLLYRDWNSFSQVISCRNIDNFTKWIHDDIQTLHKLFGIRKEHELTEYYKMKRKDKLVTLISEFFLRGRFEIGLKSMLTVQKSISTIPDSTKIWIFDATAEYLVKSDNDYWRVLKEYQTNYEVQNIDLLNFNFNREITGRSKTGYERIERTKEAFLPIIDYVKNNQDKKILILIWKTVGLGKGDSVENVNYVSGNNINLPDLIREELQDFNNFQCISYSGTKVRGTNEFKDYDTFLFIPDWEISPSYLEDLSCVMKNKVDNEMYLLSELKQAIFRTRARESKPINLVFAYDFRDMLCQFIQNKLLQSAINSEYQIEMFKWKRDNLLNVNIILAEQINKILEYKLKSVEDMEKFKEGMELKFTLNEIFELLPKNKKESYRYRVLVDKFNEIYGNSGSFLSISSN